MEAGDDDRLRINAAHSSSSSAGKRRSPAVTLPLSSLFPPSLLSGIAAQPRYSQFAALCFQRGTSAEEGFLLPLDGTSVWSIPLCHLFQEEREQEE